MKNFLEYYFYIFYCIIIKTGEKSSPYVNTYIGIAALATFNAMSILPYFGINVTSPGLWLVLFLFNALASYFLFIYKGKYLAIYQIHRQKVSNKKLKKLIIFVISYKILSFALLIYTVVNLRNGVDMELFFLK